MMMAILYPWRDPQFEASAQLGGKGLSKSQQNKALRWADDENFAVR